MFKKLIIPIMSLTIFLFSCKESSKNIKIQNSLKNNVLHVDTIKPAIQKVTTEDTNENNKLGFVISCGSGCALTYNVLYIEMINKYNYEIKFNVTNFINEQILQENIEIYNYEFDSSGTLNNIHLKGENSNLILDKDLLIRNDLKEIGAKLWKNKNL